MLTPNQIEIIKATVPVLAQYGNTVTDTFYRNVLHDAPALNEVFNQGHQLSGAQAKALAGALYAYAKHIDNLEVLSSAISHITNKHASLFVTPDQYTVVGGYLLSAFAEVLGAAFTPEIRDAWAAAYQQLADIMIAAEKQLYAQRGTWTTWREFTVSSKTPESTEITSFHLVPVDNIPLPIFTPGQYISVKLHIPSLGYSQTRQYSLSDKPCPKSYRISVKREPGLHTGAVDTPAKPGFVSEVLHSSVNVGDTILLSHPSGDFVLDKQSATTSPTVLISAGVGVTPLTSMLNTLLAEPSEPISWIHGCRDTKVQAFREHVREQERFHENLRVTLFVKDTTDEDRLGHHYDHAGRVDLSKCDEDQDLFVRDDQTRYYVCGPVGFMAAIQLQLEELGVDRARIRMERFGTGGL